MRRHGSTRGSRKARNLRFALLDLALAGVASIAMALLTQRFQAARCPQDTFFWASNQIPTALQIVPFFFRLLPLGFWTANWLPLGPFLEDATSSPIALLRFCLARSSSARRISRTVSGIEDNIETRCSFVHGRSPASAKAGDHFKPRTRNRPRPSPRKRHLIESRIVPRLRRSRREKVDPSPVDVESSPRGRILPSLVPDEPLRRPLRRRSH